MITSCCKNNEGNKPHAVLIKGIYSEQDGEGSSLWRDNILSETWKMNIY